MSARHPMSRSSRCAQCRSGWLLAYGQHTVRHWNRGSAFCGECRSFVSYWQGRFQDHYGRGARKHMTCKGSGSPIASDEAAS